MLTTLWWLGKRVVRWFVRNARRKRLWFFMSFGTGAALTWYYRVAVHAWLLEPADGRLSPTGVPVFTAPAEVMSTTIHLSMMGGIIASTPMAAFIAFRLLRRVLEPRERRFAMLVFPAALFLFGFGTAFAYYAVLPAALIFLFGFGTDIAEPLIRISEYITFVTTVMLWMGVVFELPLVMFLLAKTRAVPHTRFWRYRKIVFIVSVVLAVIISPTSDYFGFLLFFLPLITLFWVGLFLAWMVRPGVVGKPHRCWRMVRQVACYLTKSVLLPTLMAGTVVGLVWWEGLLEVRVG